MNLLKMTKKQLALLVVDLQLEKAKEQVEVWSGKRAFKMGSFVQDYNDKELQARELKEAKKKYQELKDYKNEINN